MNEKISYNTFHGDIISLFNNNLPLNNEQKEFIKQFINDINNCCTLDYDSISAMIANEGSAIPIWAKALFYNAFQKPFNKIFCNFLKKLQQCYKEKIINENGYILILKRLLYCNTDSICLELANNIFEIKDKKLDKDKPLCSLFINICKLYPEKYYDTNDNHDKWLFSNTNELQSRYELYKSIMNQIISDLLTILVFDNNQPCTKEVIEKTIFEPIILGMLKPGYNLGDNIKQLFLKFKDNISVIDQEFGIMKLYEIKNTKRRIKQDLFRFYIKDKKTGEEKSRISSKYITRQIDSYLPQEKLPYEVKYKDKKNK